MLRMLFEGKIIFLYFILHHTIERWNCSQTTASRVLNGAFEFCIMSFSSVKLPERFQQLNGLFIGGIDNRKCFIHMSDGVVCWLTPHERFGGRFWTAETAFRKWLLLGLIVSNLTRNISQSFAGSMENWWYFPWLVGHSYPPRDGGKTQILSVLMDAHH